MCDAAVGIDCVLLVRRVAGTCPPPTLVHAFFHSSWECVWAAGRVLRDGSVVFRVRGTLRPLRKSTLELAVLPCAHDALARCCDGKLRVGDVLKVHFYRPLDGKRQAPEFAFATAVQADSLARAFDMTHLGVWNSFIPECVQSAQPHPSWIVHALCVSPTTMPAGVETPPGDAPLPGPQHYRTVMDVCEWISASLEQAYPKHRGDNFIFPATCMRDGYSMALLQDLPRLISRPGSCLPPTLCCYAMLHALREHEITPADFSALVERARARRRPAAARLLRAVQSVLVCFSACVVEGHYRADTINGEVADDQPYLFSKKPPADVLAAAAAAGSRVHVASALEGDLDDVCDADDCEGSTQRACIFLAEALRCMAVDRAEHTFAHTLAHFKRCKGAPLDVSHAHIIALMGCCADIGDLILQKRLRVSVVDGAVCMGTLAGRADDPPAGHCFGLLCMRSDDSEVEEGLVVETTLWTMSENPNAAAASAAAVPADVLELVSTYQDHGSLICRRGFTRATQAALYPYITLGDGHIFFTLRTGRARPDVTTTPDVVQGHGVLWVRRDDAGAAARVKTALDASGGTLALAVQTEDLLAAMDPAEPKWLGLPKSRVQGAAGVRKMYADAMATYPHMAALLRPPPEPESCILGKMRRLYGALGDEDVPTETMPSPPGLAFSYHRGRRQRGEALLAALHKRGGLRIRKHAFARSTVVTVEVDRDHLAHHV